MRSLVIVSVIAISLFACRSTVPTTRSGVEFMTDASAYAPGDSVRLQLVNHEDQEIGYNLCFSDLAREDEAGWVVVPDTMTVCTAELRLLAPGDRLTIPLDAPAEGEYELIGFFTRAQDYGIIRIHVNGEEV